MLCHDNLGNHYTTNFTLKQDWNYNMTEIDEMLPYEREIQISLIQQRIKEENKSSQNDVLFDPVKRNI